MMGNNPTNYQRRLELLRWAAHARWAIRNRHLDPVTALEWVTRPDRPMAKLEEEGKVA